MTARERSERRAAGEDEELVAAPGAEWLEAHGDDRRDRRRGGQRRRRPPRVGALYRIEAHTMNDVAVEDIDRMFGRLVTARRVPWDWREFIGAVLTEVEKLEEATESVAAGLRAEGGAAGLVEAAARAGVELARLRGEVRKETGSKPTKPRGYERCVRQTVLIRLPVDVRVAAVVVAEEIYTSDSRWSEQPPERWKLLLEAIGQDAAVLAQRLGPGGRPRPVTEGAEELLVAWARRLEEVARRSAAAAATGLAQCEARAR